MEALRISYGFKERRGKALIGLVGVQSNQFPRAVDLARPFLAAGLPVCIGGFHISGCIAMLPEMPQDMREAQALGISFFAGEAEDGRFDAVLRDARRRPSCHESTCAELPDRSRAWISDADVLPNAPSARAST